MFDLIKQQVSLLAELEKDLGVTFKQTGERNWVIDGDKDVESCPFCDHHDCFKVSYVEEEKASAFYKCFSCDAKGDVIAWRAHHKGISVGDALKELAQENGIQLPKGGSNPVQQVFNLAAAHYHASLFETNKGVTALGGRTPLDYQLSVRHRTRNILEQFKVGYSTGELSEYLAAIGVDPEVAELSGLVKDGRDFLPRGCFIYPHFVNGRASHFTFKDPLKKLAYQLPKKYSLNGYKFYNQDSIKDSNLVVVVEGENDLLAVAETGKAAAVIATIGQISAEQIGWLREQCADKKIITLFDPDGAGDKYRQKIQKNVKFFKGLRQVLPPGGMDIDEALIGGKDLMTIVRDCAVEVSLVDTKDEPEVSELDWDPAPPARQAPQKAVEAPFDLTAYQVPNEPEKRYTALLEASPGVVANPSVIPGPSVYVPPQVPEVVESDDIELQGCSVYQSVGRYWRQAYDKNGDPSPIIISDFTIELLNVYVREDGDREREIVVRKSNGRKSAPFLMGSKTKVSQNEFKILMAKVLDCSWTGREQDLDAMWTLVYYNFKDREIEIPAHVGWHTRTQGWLFKNTYITSEGDALLPDDNEIFWSKDGKAGIKPQSILSDGDIGAGIPVLDTSKTREESDFLLEGVIKNLGANLGSTGKALLSLGWMQSNVYSEHIFKQNRGMAMFMYWGKHGGGKSTVIGWLRSLFGLYENVAKTSVALLGSGAGFLRMAAYYSSLPMFLDELRSDDKSKSYTDMIRSWYDREGRPLASSQDDKRIRMQKIRATLMIAGEDIPDDPATKERIVAVRMLKDSDQRRDTVTSYAWFQEQGTSVSSIGYYWLLDSFQEDLTELMAEINKMDLQLKAAGCSSRISKKLSAAGYFGFKLAEKFCPGFPFIDYLVQESMEEQAQQANDSTLNNFWELLEVLKARGGSETKITGELVRTDGDKLYVWFPGVWHEIMEANRGRVVWTKNAIKRAIREEPYFISDTNKAAMGTTGFRKTVITLDLNKATDTIKNLAESP